MSKDKLLSGDSHWLLDMEEVIGKDLPNQQDAIRGIACSIRREVALCGELSRPLGRFLLVGRYETARMLATSLARFLYDDENALLRLDMETYAEKHQVLRLIGFNGGLVCAFWDGELNEPLWRRPRTVVLLEGIEKAHCDVWKVLEPLLQEGQLIDGLGRKVVCKNSIFMLTTMVGFAEESVKSDGSRSGDGFPLRTRDALERTFATEWLRCIGDVVLLH